ncbi:Mog1p/PsbP-like protein [Lactarius sanguifluus]|nr:Mog1p/PsbP-like protein [Lactarius sanguifluus]
MKLVGTELFGGAIIASYPEGYIDASVLRQVPDTQEVYLSPDTDESIILETLIRVPADDSSDAAKFHFNATAHDNDALSSSIEDVQMIPNDRGDATPSVIILHGRQGVRKFNRTSVDDVRISLALYRVEGKGVDLVLTLNFPMNGEGGIRTEEEYMEAKRDFYSIATSLRIVDFGLFA